MTRFLDIGGKHLTAEISPYGAALSRVWLEGHPQSLVLGLPHAEDYANAPQAIGVIVGPIAGRVSGASVWIGGRTYQMEANTPPDCLHSGSEALQHRVWDVVEHTETEVTLRCVLPDGACGLPGRRAFRVTYEIRGRSLILTIEAQTDADTLVNATSHAYWTLDETGDLTAHRLGVNSTRMLETGADLIPTGRILDVTGGPFDFTVPRDPVSGPPLDGCFCLAQEVGEALRPVLRLSSTVSGIRMTVDSNQPGVVLYTGEYLPRLTTPPGTGAIRPFSALAIESQGWPDAANHPKFPSIFLKKNGMIKNISRFSFESS